MRALLTFPSAARLEPGWSGTSAHDVQLIESAQKGIEITPSRRKQASKSRRVVMRRLGVVARGLKGLYARLRRVEIGLRGGYQLSLRTCLELRKFRFGGGLGRLRRENLLVQVGVIKFGERVAGADFGAYVDVQLR